MMRIILQNKMTGDYVERGGGWTWKQGKARDFASGLEAIVFCFERQICKMQIACAYQDLTKRFTVPVTDPTSR